MSDTKALTLYEIEDDLAALLNTEEMVEDQEQRLQILNEIAEKTDEAVAKRDSLIRFLRHLDLLMLGCKAEEDRLRSLRKSWESAKARIEEYVVRVIEEFAPEPKRGAKRLEGNLGVLSIAKKPNTVEVESLGDVPWEYLDVTLKMSGTEFKQLMEVLTACDQPTLFLRERCETTPRKKDIKDALDADKPVPGADIKIGGNRLVVR